MSLTNQQRKLLDRLRRGRLTFTGAESDDERLAMLQLYIVGYVKQSEERARKGLMDWHITPAGMDVIRASP